MTSINSKSYSVFAWMLLTYLMLVWVLHRQAEMQFESLHLLLDTSNGLLSLLLSLFLLAEQHSLKQRVRIFLVIAFTVAALTEILHALVGIEWSGSLAWIEASSKSLRPTTWPPSTYVLPLVLMWALWLKQRQSELSTRWFVLGVLVMTVMLYYAAGVLPRYVDTGLLGIQRPTQIPVLFLWLVVIAQCWRIRHEHALFTGLIGMSALLILSDFFMLYSTSPHEKFTMMAHTGKLFAYLWMHFMLMRLAAEDSQARYDAELALSAKAQQLQTSLDEIENLHFAMNQHSIVGVTDVHGTITHANETFCQISGYTRDELIGQNHRILNSGKHSPDFFKGMYRALVNGHVWHGDICNRKKNGDFYWVETTIVPFYDKAGKPQQYVAMRTDITARKLAEAELLNIALYDNLTQLPNRRLLYERLEQGMEFGARSQRYGALLFLDLDHFKPLNDQYGHNVGDLLLQEVARRIKDSVRAIDTAARFGGDEFVVLLGDLSTDQAESMQLALAVAEKIRLALWLPYRIEFKQADGVLELIEHRCSTCIGVTLFEGKKQAAEYIVQMADLTMYQAKEHGPNVIRVCSSPS